MSPVYLPDADQRRPHTDCWFDEEACAEGKPDTCPPELARRRRREEKAAHGGPWSALELRQEDSGPRHYLDGKAVHCGACIELQALGWRDDDYGSYTVPLNKGQLVRYEASLVTGNVRVTLHADVAGREFVAGLESGMRFRWPVRK